MKKRFLIAAILIVALWFFAGCPKEAVGCSHQWSNITCEAAQICTLCGEVAEEALGHDFADATCENPKTCTRCGLTDSETLDHDFADATCEKPRTCTRCSITDGTPLGHHLTVTTCDAPGICTICGMEFMDVLPHDYSTWSVDDEKMTRFCKQCSSVETAELDRVAVVGDQLAGRWHLSYIVNNGLVGDTHKRSGMPMYVDAADDGSLCWFVDENQTLEYTYEFADYSEDGTGYSYLCKLTNMADGSCIRAEISPLEDDTALSIFVDENYYCIFVKQEEWIDYMSGTWAAVVEDELYTLQLNPDYSFTSNLDGDISGTWFLKPVRLYEYGFGDFDYWYCRLVIMYEKNGEIRFVEIEHELGPKKDYFLEFSRADGMHYFTIDYWCEAINADVKLQYMTEDGLDYLKASMKEDGFQEIIGNWNLERLSVYTPSSGQSELIENLDCSATFYDNGTCIFAFDEEKQGTWKPLRKEYFSTTGQFNWFYELKFHDDPQIYSLQMSKVSTGENLSLFKNMDDCSMTYWFAPAE